MTSTAQPLSGSGNRSGSQISSGFSDRSSAADFLLPYSFEAVDAPVASKVDSPTIVLSASDEVERASAQLSTVFPSFLSVLHGGTSRDNAHAVDREPQAAAFAGQNETLEKVPESPEASELWQQGWQAGHAQGREEGVRQAQEAVAAEDRASSEAALDRARHELLRAVEDFHADRERYFHEVEQEAVRLALAIAARILRREAQMDPLLLSGAVRVALGQLGESTTIRLIVPEADRLLWEESLRLTPGLRLRPEVVGDARMELGECRIQTDFGGADLSLHEQLREIERGFFDRVPQRSSVSDPVAVPVARTASDADSMAVDLPQPAGSAR